jgi:hypothetical protein
MEQRVELTGQTAATVVAGQQFSIGSPFRYLFIVVAVIVIGQFWLSRPAPFRAAAQRGGWRLVIAVLSSLSMLVFGIGIAMGQLVIGIAALIVGAPLTWFLFVSFMRDRSQASD